MKAIKWHFIVCKGFKKPGEKKKKKLSINDMFRNLEP